MKNPWNSFKTLPRTQQIQWGSCVFLSLVFLYILVYTSRVLFFNYDELFQTHTIWLLSEGYTPLVDFFFAHPPLGYYLLTPIQWAFGETTSILFFYRGLTIFGNLFFLGAIYLHVREIHLPRHHYWFFMGLFLLSFHNTFVAYLVEFRLDSWSYALILYAHFQFGRRDNSWKKYCEYAVICCIALLLMPKIALFPIVFTSLDLVSRWKKGETLLAPLGGLVLGGVISLGVGAVFLGLMGVNLYTSLGLSYTFFSRVNQYLGQHFNFVSNLLYFPAHLTVVALSLILWGVHWYREKKVHPFEVTVVMFFVFQLAMVNKPWKQYFAPLFFLGSIFFPYLGWGLDRWIKSRQIHQTLAVLAFVALAVLGVKTGLDMKKYSTPARGHLGAKEQIYIIDTLLKMAPPGQTVVAPYQFHPLFRLDSFYMASEYFHNPLRERGTYELMTEVSLPGVDFSKALDRLRPSYYLPRLEESSPAVLVVHSTADEGSFNPAQNKAIRKYLDRHKPSYRHESINLQWQVWYRPHQ